VLEATTSIPAKIAPVTEKNEFEAKLQLGSTWSRNLDDFDEIGEEKIIQRQKVVF
jgi:hypothetical protein